MITQSPARLTLRDKFTSERLRELESNWRNFKNGTDRSVKLIRDRQNTYRNKEYLMKWILALLVIAGTFVGGILFATSIGQPLETESGVGQAGTTSGKVDVNFDKMMQVLTHQRCVNCHPGDGVPKQGDDRHPHYFGIERGKKNVGFESTKCSTCHQEENNAFSGVPGAPEWSLAPESMRWEGLTRTEIAESMLDPKRNGNRTHDQVMHHLTEHALVLWAWDPGVDANGRTREKPPVPRDEYISAVKKWFKDGAIIPDE